MVTWSSLRLAPWISCATFTTTTTEALPFHPGLPNQAEKPRLHHNNGNGTFTDVTDRMRLDRVILSMGLGFGDLNNHGFLDCYCGTGTPDYEALLPNRMFRNDHGRVFQDVTTSGGFGQLQKGHAISFANFNRDGNEDIFEVLGGAAQGDTYMDTLLENPGHANNWIGLKLTGSKSNRSAIGARIKVTTPAQIFYRVVNSGSSFGDTPLEQHIGLGSAQQLTEVEIKWPSGMVQHLSRLNVNSVYQVREGDNHPAKPAVSAFSYAHMAHYQM